jgi:SAM-dependent methyltransferase
MENASPDPILKAALGFMAAKHLFVASEIGLFEALAAGSATLAELAERVGVPARTARILADAMASLGLIEKAGDRYRNTPASAAFLSGAREAGLRPALRLFDRISYRNWLDLEGAVRTDGGHSQWGRMSKEEQRIASEGIAALTAPVAAALAEGYDFAPHRHVLDLGGGTGNFLRAVLARHPQLSGTLYELPDTAAVARRELAGKPEAARIAVVAGDLFTDPLPPDADTIIIANLVHLFAPARNREMLARVRQQAARGARLLLVDFWTDPSRTLPPPAALMAGEFLLFAGTGDVYSAEEGDAWLGATGWRPLKHQPLAGPQSLILAEAG